MHTRVHSHAHLPLPSFPSWVETHAFQVSFSIVDLSGYYSVIRQQGNHAKIWLDNFSLPKSNPQVLLQHQELSCENQVVLQLKCCHITLKYVILRKTKTTLGLSLWCSEHGKFM